MYLLYLVIYLMAANSFTSRIISRFLTITTAECYVETIIMSSTYIETKTMEVKFLYGMYQFNLFKMVDILNNIRF